MKHEFSSHYVRERLLTQAPFRCRRNTPCSHRHLKEPEAMANLERPALVDYRNNGKKPKPTFSAPEMQRRQDAMRGWMARSQRRCLPVHQLSQHLLPLGLPLLLLRPQIWPRHDPEGGDLGHRRHRRRPARPPHLRRQHHLHGLVEGQLLHWREGADQGCKAHRHRVRSRQSVDFRKQLQDAFPGVEFVDCRRPVACACAWIKSAEEIKHIAKMTRSPTSAVLRVVEAIGRWRARA
jgi:hypothetical protein